MEEEYEGIMGRKSKFYSTFFFIIGLIGAVGFRIVLIVNKWSTLSASLIWYIAVTSYILFYLYRYYIEQKRRQILVSGRLKYKLDNGIELNEQDRKNIKLIIDSLMVSKQNLNLIILVIVSIVSLIIQIVLDFIIR
ncbi:MAG: hypothetical protein PHH54_04045 [Candidatus Nanoarchaeia archaeon]|nr:hypothetical protein [Candidatus Nanoarchaeia archaeon]MDD5741131.1 hypothetical protein [Candidatus Nanoarchaeia archaeon]